MFSARALLHLKMTHCDFDWSGIALDIRLMSRNEILKALERNRPFVLRTADGREYAVPHRDFLALAPNASYVVVFDEAGKNFDVLPLLTMTGLRQAGQESAA